MYWKHLFSVLIIFLSIIFATSCIKEFGVTFPSINKGKLERKEFPANDFTQAIFDYKKRYGYWPKSEVELGTSNRQVMDKLFNSGFQTWHLGYASDDTLYAYFIHEPIIDGTHVGIVPIPDKKIFMKGIYIYSTGYFNYQKIKKRRFMKESY